MKLNKKNRWNSLLALVAAGIITQAAPAAFALAVTDAQIWADLAAYNSTVTQANLTPTKGKTPPSVSVIQAALLSVISNNAPAGSENLYAHNALSLVLTTIGSKAAKGETGPLAYSALLGVETTTGYDKSSAAIQSLINVAQTANPKLDVIALAKNVAGDPAPGVLTNGNIPELANAAAVILAVAKPKNTIGLASAFATVVGIDYAAVAGKIAAALAASDLKDKSGIAIALTTGHTSSAAAIADAVARTTASNPVSEATIVASVSSVASVDGTAVRLLVEATSISEQKAIVDAAIPSMSGTGYFNSRAAAYANVAASYASKVPAQAVAGVTQAAQAAVVGIPDAVTGGVNGNGATGADYYVIAQAFGNALSKKDSVKVTPGTLAFSRATTVAQTVGADLQALLATKGTVTDKSTQAYNLTEVFGAVAVGLTHKLAVKDLGNITNVMTALIGIQPVSAPDMLGLVLADLNAGSRGMTYKLALPLYTAISAYVATHGGTETNTQLTAVWTHTYVDSTPTGKKRNYVFSPVVGYVYGTYGTLTGQETPINNL
jgi:hypothetical protein